MSRFTRVAHRMNEAEQREMQSVDEATRRELPELNRLSKSIPRTTIQLRVTPEIHEAFSTWCESHETDVSTLLRDAALRTIGRADLIGSMPSRGRPEG